MQKRLMQINIKGQKEDIKIIGWAKTVRTIEWNKAIADESPHKVYLDGPLV